MTEKPVWVVELVGRNRSLFKPDRDTKYVRARTAEGAIRCAKFYSWMPGADFASAYARLATPRDLGCVEVAA